MPHLHDPRRPRFSPSLLLTADAFLDGWSVDNLVVIIPEPTSGALMLAGVLAMLRFGGESRVIEVLATVLGKCRIRKS